MDTGVGDELRASGSCEAAINVKSTAAAASCVAPYVLMSPQPVVIDTGHCCCRSSAIHRSPVERLQGVPRECAIECPSQLNPANLFQTVREAWREP